MMYSPLAMIELQNVELLAFEDMVIDGREVPREDVAEIDINQDIPIQLRVGAVNFRIGIINLLRKGFSGLNGDLKLQIQGELILGLEGKRVKPIAYRYTVES